MSVPENKSLDNKSAENKSLDNNSANNSLDHKSPNNNSFDTNAFINTHWDNSIIPTLCDYIRIPNKSPAYDPNWESDGHMDKAVKLVAEWCQKQNIRGLKLEVIQLPQKTPLLFIEIPGDSDQTLLFYGHLDKQPEMTGWREGLSPWTPVIEDHKLFGRGGADDGYAIFACLTAISALQQQGQKHAQCVILMECSEESGSIDLPAYLEALEQRIPTPDFVICLDSGTDDYERLSSTISLRGIINGHLHVDVSSSGVHSGAFGGMIPSSFRILRQLLERLENSVTGEMLLPELSVTIPDQVLEQVKASAEACGHLKLQSLPLLPGVKPVADNLTELLLNSTWRAVLEVTGADGLPPSDRAGNVLRPGTGIVFSIRIPPTADPIKAQQAIKETLLRNPPYNAKVTLEMNHTAGGWCAPPTAPWLAKAMDDASQRHYGHSAAYLGEGGSIPFMDMLGKRFPNAQFLITGVLGPHSNAHGPNEFLHVPYAKKLTACIADIVRDHYLKG